MTQVTLSVELHSTCLSWARSALHSQVAQMWLRHLAQVTPSASLHCSESLRRYYHKSLTGKERGSWGMATLSHLFTKYWGSTNPLSVCMLLSNIAKQTIQALQTPCLSFCLFNVNASGIPWYKQQNLIKPSMHPKLLLIMYFLSRGDNKRER